jgi:hypothetical protein
MKNSDRIFGRCNCVSFFSFKTLLDVLFHEFRLESMYRATFNDFNM